jgi:hypothetical protein
MEDGSARLLGELLADALLGLGLARASTDKCDELRRAKSAPNTSASLAGVGLGGGLGGGGVGLDVPS